VNIEIDDCYAKVKADKKESTFKKCVALDYVASKWDAYVLKSLHRAQTDDSRNSLDAVSARADQTLDDLGFDVERQRNLIIASIITSKLALSILTERALLKH
jgi:hypothetical protein